MHGSELDTLVLLLQQQGLAAWRRMLGGSECVMVGADPLESGAIRGWRRAAHIWQLESGEWRATVEGFHAGTFATCQSVASYIGPLLNASQDTYEQETSRIIASHAKSVEA